MNKSNRGFGKKPNKNNRKRQGGNGPARSSIVVQPRLYPIVKFTRTFTGTMDITTNGIAPNIGDFYFTLDMLAQYTDFTNLFLQYRLEKIRIQWKPEYTELTDAALVSNAVNVNFNSSIANATANSPTSVDDVLSCQSLKQTSITKQHSRSFEPASLMNNMFCNCYIGCDYPSDKHYAIWYAIPPTGVAMTFRSTITFTVVCAGAR